MTKPLANRIALVTGGSRGIGHALAIALAREGAHVVATARTPGGLEELDDAIKAAGGTATLVPLEMRDSAGIARLAGALNERYGKLDILIGNAALGASSSPLDHFEAKEWDEVIAVNVTANWHLIRHMHALLMRSDAGRVVFLTSNAASNPRAYRGLYATSKAALEAMARTYANETLIDADQGQPPRSRPDPDADARGGRARRRPDDLADGGGGRGNDCADVPAELSGNRKDLRFPRRQAAFVPAAGIASDGSKRAPDYPRTRSDGRHDP